MIKEQTYRQLIYAISDWKMQRGTTWTSYKKNIEAALDIEFPNNVGKINHALSAHYAVKFDMSYLSPEEMIKKFITADSKVFA